MRTWRATFLVLGLGVVGAQAPPNPTFDVAVIHPAGAPTQDAVRSGQFRAGTTISKENAEFNYVTLADLIPYAYRTKPFQVAGPALLKETRWNIQATFTAASTDQVPEMMQALLEDRFKLAFHSEKRDLPVYELVVAKGGPKMEEVEAVAAPVEPVQQLPGPAGRFGGPRPDGGRGKGQDGKAQDFKGKGKGQFGGGRGARGPFGALGDSVKMEPSPDTCGIKLTFAKVSMASLADALAPFLDRPVLDSTGLKGSYKAAMILPQDAMRLVMQNQAQNSGLDGLGGGGRGGFAGGGPGGRGGGGGGAAAGGGGNGKGKGKGGPGGCDAGGSQATGSDTNSSPAIFQGVQQLGLRLQPKKAPFDTLVVDHVEKQPTEN